MSPLISRRNFLQSVGAGAASLAVSGCAARGPYQEPAKGPNVLLIVSEDHGPHLGCYGDPSARTPNLDRLAKEGVRYARAYITYPVCSPSRSSILTGLYPHQNGQIGLATHKYAMFEAFPNLPSLLKGAGYRTGIIGKLHVNPESAFPFDFRWNDGRQISFNHRDVRRIAEVAGDFIGASGEPFFLMVNYPDAHFNLLEQYKGIPQVPLKAEDVAPLPFVGVDTPRIREYVADYYNCLSRLDTGVGLLLSELERSGKSDDTLVIFISDHGAQFSRGKCTCYEGGVHVPLILRRPGHIAAGGVRDELVSAIDLLPTVLDAAGVSAPDDLPGRSLAPLNRGETVPWRRYVFCEKDGSAPFWFFPRRSIRDDRYKLIRNLIRDRPDPIPAAYATGHNTFFHAGAKAEEIAASPAPIREAYRTWEEAPPVELYDLEQDPNEFENLAGRPEYGEVQRRLLAALKAWQEETRDPLRDPEKLALLKKEMDTVVRDKVNYRKEKSFRWKYLDYLRTR